MFSIREVNPGHQEQSFLQSKQAYSLADIATEVIIGKLLKGTRNI